MSGSGVQYPNPNGNKEIAELYRSRVRSAASRVSTTAGRWVR